MRLKWTKRALSQFKKGIDYIEEDHPVNANLVASRVANAIEMLLSEPGMGHEGRVKGTLEWVVLKSPFIIVYRVEKEVLSIVRLIPQKEHPAKQMKH